MNESKLPELPGGWVWMRLGSRIKKPQINADERRLIVFDFESLFEVYSDRKIVQTLTGQLKLINSLQTTSMWQGEVHQPRNRTAMLMLNF